MRCQHCNHTVRAKTAVCPFCGAAMEKKPPMKRWKKWLIGVFGSVGAAALALAVTAVSFGASLLGRIDRTSELNAGDVAVNSALPQADVVKNIALFGLDTRQDSEVGHSDAIIILSIDYIHDKINLTSIARDSLVWYDAEDYAFSPKPTDAFQSKLTHAFWWGSHAEKGGGPQVAVKTLNKNFGLNITDYAFVNFFEFAELIDYIGGVEIDVSASEMYYMNTKYIPHINDIGITCARITKTGRQKLSGGQTLAYSRDRFSGSDIERGNHHKEVLEAMFAAVKDTSLTKYPAMIGKILDMCHTSLSNDELFDIATWTLTKHPSIVQFGLPSPECNAETGDRGDGFGDVVRYDLDFAADLLYMFIYEQEPK